jgi:hypothetical protein
VLSLNRFSQSYFLNRKDGWAKIGVSGHRWIEIEGSKAIFVVKNLNEDVSLQDMARCPIMSLSSPIFY